ncbi:MAG TPA: GAF domain-containing protein, partial [Candidatus Acidoferrales bacterium]
MDTAGTRATRALPDDILTTLAETGEEIASSLDLDKVLGRVAALVKRLVDSDILGVLLLDSQTQTLSYRFASGYSREVVENWRIPVGQGIPGVAAATREPVRVADLRQDPRNLGMVESARSELAVPLLFRNQVIGVLDIHSPDVDHFTQQQEEVLVLLASRLAMAIENARLFERAQTQAETLLLLNEVGREASAILDVEVLLRRAAELVK